MLALRRFLFPFFLFISLFLPLQRVDALLTSSNVKEVMEQLFNYHVDKKEMTPIVLERSLKIYVKQFDPNHAYLLQQEVVPYLSPTEVVLQEMLVDYQNDRLTTFFSLNQLIQKSIVRARQWRAEWEKNPKKLVQAAVGLKGGPSQEKLFAATLDELKNKHYERFLRFLAFQMKELGPTAYAGKESKIVALCEKQMTLLENEYLGVDDHGRALTHEEHGHHVIQRMLKSLAHSLDAHSAYYSPEEAYAMKVQLEKGMCGIGVVLREGIEGITIQDILKGGPAEQSTLQPGDTIVEVDGVSVEGFSFQRVLEVMRGKEGTRTVLGVVHYDSPNPRLRRVELTRAKIVLADKRVDISKEPFEDGFIGKITLHSFYEGEDGLSSEVDLKKAIDQLREEGPLYGLVLDMRENSGGFLSQAVKVSGLFISSGVVVISKYSDGSIKHYRTVDGKRHYDGPLVILISRGSASATEIVAQTLRDYGVALIVGDEQTYGKGTIQHQTVTSDRSQSFFKVTIGRYYTVSGKSTQIEGVKSDILVPTEYHFEEVGERYLEYPLPSDEVPAAFDDTLVDIDPFSRKWFYKYYIPTLQAPDDKWISLIPLLQENSKRRLALSSAYQTFLKEAKGKKISAEKADSRSSDLQMEEAVHIVEDMIYLSNAGRK